MTDKATPKRHSRKGLYAPFILLLDFSGTDWPANPPC